MHISRVIFYSRSQIKVSNGGNPGLLKEILAACSVQDTATGITGALLFNEQYFLQAMEGERVQLSRKLAQILRDDRHADVVILKLETILVRAFQGWSVAYAAPVPEISTLLLKYGPTGDFQPSRMAPEAIIGLFRDLLASDGKFLVKSVSVQPRAVAAQPKAVSVQPRAAGHNGGVPVVTPPPGTFTDSIMASRRNV